MAKGGTVYKTAGGFIVKHAGEYFKVPKKFIKSQAKDGPRDVAKRIAKSGDDVSQFPKPKKMRNAYLGKTPGKLSGPGQKVAQRMAKKGELVDALGNPVDPDTFPKKIKKSDLDNYYVNDANGVPRPLSETHMGHHEDAVDYWNDRGHQRTPQQNRDFMTNDKNYSYEYGPDNTSKGGQQQGRYSDNDPVGGVTISPSL
ncbi:hypothetical protein ACQBAU_00160 [Propionibacteriaceae bacterium Y2011]